MIKPETIDESKDHLGEPLLVPTELSPSFEENCKRRNSTSKDQTAETLETEEPPGQDHWISFTLLRRLWVFFQCVWPAIVTVSNPSYGEFMIATVLPWTLLFLCLVTFAKECNHLQSRQRDLLPTAAWILLATLRFAPEEWDVVIFGVLANCFCLLFACYRCDVSIFEFSSFKHMEEEFFKHLEEEKEAEEKENPEAQITTSLSSAHPRPSAVFLIVLLAALWTWEIAFIWHTHAAFFSVPDSRSQGFDAPFAYFIIYPNANHH